MARLFVTVVNSGHLDFSDPRLGVLFSIDVCKNARMAYIPRKNSPAGGKPFAKRPAFARSRATGAASAPRPYTRSVSSSPRPYVRRDADAPAQSARPYTRSDSAAPRPYTRSASAAFKPRASASSSYSATVPPRARGATAPFRGNAETRPRTSDTRESAPFPQKAPYRPSAGASLARTRIPRSSYPSKSASAARAASSSREEKPVRKYSAPKPERTKLASFAPNGTTNPATSWGEVADWYDTHLSKGDTYHEKVILPNILRLVEPTKGETILDLACGQGFFAKAFAQKGATLTGVDISEELITIAKQEAMHITFHVGSAEALSMLKDKSFDKAVIVLAIQNIEHINKVLSEAARVLKVGGTFHIVMNHPAFRIPKRSSWEYDDKKKVQFRRVEQYASESRESIDMHPGMKDSPQTLSFHRPLQYYFKLLGKAGFAVDRLEEWISHKSSDSGPRAKAENLSRKEIPLFLYLRAQKIA